MGVISDLIPDIDGILGVRDSLGAALKQVYFVTRTWSGAEVGDGTFTETRVRMLPSPRVVVFQNDLRLREAGSVKMGDVQLKMVSKESYQQTDLDFSNVTGAVEKFYELSGELYRPIQVTEKHVVWSVLLRRAEYQGDRN